MGPGGSSQPSAGRRRAAERDHGQQRRGEHQRLGCHVRVPGRIDEVPVEQRGDAVQQQDGGDHGRDSGAASAGGQEAANAER